jgi:hypothetical protein
MRLLRSLVVVLTFFILAIPMRVLAAGGSILYLLAWGGYAPDTPVTVQTTVQVANKRINNSNLYYTITGPDPSATLRATHTTPISGLNAYQAYTDEWSTTNTGWPAGTYVITLCWSTGNAQNCDIAGPVTTTFESVPTLGWGLGILGFAILIYWFWRRRAEFESVRAR